MISCYQSFPPVSAHWLISLWHFRCLRMGKIDVITYKYVINNICTNWVFDRNKTSFGIPMRTNGALLFCQLLEMNHFSFPYYIWLEPASNAHFCSVKMFTYISEAEVPRETHRPVASHWQTISSFPNEIHCIHFCNCFFL